MDNLESQKIMYLDITHKLNDYNEIYNLNTHLKNNYSDELDKLKSLDNTVKSRVLRLKQDYMLYLREIKAYRFRTNMLYYTAIQVVGLLFILVALHIENDQLVSQRMVMIIGAIIIISYLIITLFIIKGYVERSTTSYDQVYWNQMKPSA